MTACVGMLQPLIPALGHFCSPDNIKSAYHITIKVKGDLRGRLSTVQFRSSPDNMQVYLTVISN